MASQKTKFTVGLFVASGIAMVIVAFIWLGMSRVLEKGRQYVTYFDESVQGLGRDSPVKYRGVSIGRVVKIDVAPDSRLIEVLMNIETGLSLDRDMVAQLNPVGITGAMFVQMDRKEPGEPDLSPRIDFSPEYPVVASKPSEIGKLFRSIDEILSQMKKLDLESVSNRIIATLDHANKLMTDAHIREIAAEVESSLKEVNRMLKDDRFKRIGASLEHSAASFATLLDKSHTTVEQMGATLARVDRIVEHSEKPLEETVLELRTAVDRANELFSKGIVLMDGAGSGFTYLKGSLLTIGQNLENASENLNIVLENLANEPARFLLAEPPPPRELEHQP